jgi:hypothetical protein
LVPSPNGSRGVLNHPSFRFGEAAYLPHEPALGPWPAASSHFRLVLAHDFERRLLSEPADLPRDWGHVFWVPQTVAHAKVTSRPGHHFWIMPKETVLAGAGLNGHKIVPLKNRECVGTAVRLYDEYLQGEEATSLNLDGLGRYLIAIAARVLNRGA